MIERYIIDEHGDVVPAGPILEWANWFESRNNGVARTVLSNGMVVSTIFLGIDYRFGLGQAPLLFESIVFFGEGTWAGPYRYPDWTTAAAHHLELVELWGQRGPCE